MELEEKDRQLFEIQNERNRLEDENRVSRMSMQGLTSYDDIAG